MNWFDPVWLYCERGTQTALFAEPVNALSNLAFFVAALAALWLYYRQPFSRRSADHLLLIALTALIGLGSLLFHLYANQWSEMADMAPIFLFMLVYLAHVLNRMLSVPPGWTLLLSSLFALVTLAAMTMTCGTLDAALQPAWARGAPVACLNGSVGYLPALVVLLLIAVLLRRRGHRAATPLFVAAGLFLTSVALRSIDHLVCDVAVWQGHAIGTHVFWHLCNGALLYLLLRAAILHQTLPPVQEILPPERRAANRE